MRKFIVYLFLLFLCVFCFSACNVKYDTVVEDESDTVVSMFVIIEDGDWFSVVYHTETKVIYTVSKGGYGGRGVFTLLVDKDGNPLLWDK